MTVGGIGIGSAIAIYFILWWLALFLVLPWGITSQRENDSVFEGSDPGAPVTPRLGIKLIAATLIAGILFAVFIFIINSGLSLDDIPL